MSNQDAIEYLLYMKHDVYMNSPMDIALDTAIEALKQPAINPIRHGQWRIIDIDFNCWRCMCCGEEWVLNDGNPSDNGMKFCPHCGARMDGGDDNEK